MAELAAGVVNYNVAVREWQDQVVFLYRITPGRTDKSYGIHVAQLAGVPQQVLTRSREVLNQLEQGFSRQSHQGQMAKPRPPEPHQLQLFAEPTNELIERLKQIEIDQITPLDALAQLKELRDQARGD